MKIPILLLLVRLYPSDCDNTCEPPPARARGSNGTEAGPEYSVRSVERQFIVTCRGWFSEAARRGYISAALRTLGGEVTVLGRDNPMAGLPSDFDLVKVSRRGPSSCLPLTTLPGWRKQNHWSLLVRRLPSSLFCFLWKAWNRRSCRNVKERCKTYFA